MTEGAAESGGAEFLTEAQQGEQRTPSPAMNEVEAYSWLTEGTAATEGRPVLEQPLPQAQSAHSWTPTLLGFAALVAVASTLWMRRKRQRDALAGEPLPLIDYAHSEIDRLRAESIVSSIRSHRYSQGLSSPRDDGSARGVEIFE